MIRKDVKTGMMIGVILVIIAFIWISIRSPFKPVRVQQSSLEIEYSKPQNHAN